MHCHAAVCDDNAGDREFLSQQVQAWAAARNKSLRLEVYDSAEAFLFQYDRQKDYDLLLLDIEMGGMDGVALARQVRQSDRLVQLIFVTGYTDYIAQGYEVSALHYLTKPVDPKKLWETLDRAVIQLKRSERFLLLEHSGGLERIPLYQIAWAEVQRNQLTLHAQRDFFCKMPLSQLESQLDDRFFRAGRSYLINLDLVQSVTRKEVRLSTGAAIPLARGLYEPLNRAILSRS